MRFLLPFLAACAPATKPDALAEAEAAVETVLLAAELLSHAGNEDPYRHNGACGCPCTEAVGTADSYVAELDYTQPSCEPSSGLTPAMLGGHLWIDMDDGDIHLERSELMVDGELLELLVDGRWEGTPFYWVGQLRGEIDGTHVDVRIAADGALTVDGMVGRGRFEEAKFLPRPADGCARPANGVYRVGGAEVTWQGTTGEVLWNGESESFDSCE